MSETATIVHNLPAELTEPHVFCIVLNWNGWQDSLACLKALTSSTYPHLTPIIVDNGSTNDSVNRIRAAYPNMMLLETKANLGFAGGNNVGIRYALAHGADYVWLLNNDSIPAPDALSALVNKAQSDPGIGAVASICYYADAPSTVQAWAGARINLWIGYCRLTTAPHVDEWFHTLNGTSILIPRSAMQDVGLLDEGFFLYSEDTDFCLRLRKRGWRIAGARDSRVLHRVHASTGGSEVILDRYQTASGLRLLRLHSPVPRVASVLFLTIRLARRLFRFQLSRCKSVWQGIKDYFQMLPISPKIR